VVLLRPVPGRTVIHDLWAGTKLIVVAAVGVLLTFYPGWIPIGLVAVLVLTTAWLARIPRGVLPSVPVWMWLLALLGGGRLAGDDVVEGDLVEDGPLVGAQRDPDALQRLRRADIAEVLRALTAHPDELPVHGADDVGQ